ALCFRKAPKWVSNSIKGSFLIQSASYAVLFGGYWLVSGTSLYTRMEVVPPEQMSAPGGVVMFFISAADGNVYRSEPGTTKDAKIANLGSTNYYRDHLELRESTTNSDRWDIVAVLDRHQEQVIIPDAST